MNTSYKAEDSSTRRHHITRLVGRYMVIQSCAAALEEAAEAQPAEDILSMFLKAQREALADALFIKNKLS